MCCRKATRRNCSVSARLVLVGERRHNGGTTLPSALVKLAGDDGTTELGTEDRDIHNTYMPAQEKVAGSGMNICHAASAG
ncbi:hypothetical protein BaRGS_00034697 [Batillaria attramentaria]|uniref:Uncharacterized protein n=1 Tax=Batillaria attramentaria TaxID=370345 RepID=A0ABD0JHF4_9CAEN